MSKKNILLIVVDCARAEKTVADLPLATAATRRSAILPFMEDLRTRGTTFDAFMAVSSTTTPNFASMFTGLLPVEHGIYEHSRHSLYPDVATLAERLRAAGYHTHAEMTGPLIPEAGLDRGFDRYRYRERTEYLHLGFSDHLCDLLPRLPEPWFLCVHLWEAHMPYQSAAPCLGPDYGLTPYDRALSLADHGLARAFAGLDSERTAVVYTADHGERLPCDYELNAQLGGGEIAVLRVWERYLAQGGGIDYDGWFEQARAELGEVLARIYAHNVLGHGFHLTEELIRIPLIIVDPERFPAGELRTDLRSQTDLFATLLDMAGIAVPANGDSVSLAGHRDGDFVYIEANGSGGKQYASRCYLRGARSADFKYWRIEAPNLEHRVLWDLRNDYRETANVIELHPDTAAAMDRFVTQQTARRSERDSGLTEAEAALIEDRLRDLGYL